MTDQSKNQNSSNSTAFQLMAFNLLEDILAKSDTPGFIETILTDQLRELTGAKIVVLCQCLHSFGGTGHRITSVNPERGQERINSLLTSEFYHWVHSMDGVTLMDQRDRKSPNKKMMASLDFDLSILIPLKSDSVSVGCLLLLGLPDRNNINMIVNIMKMLSKIITLVFRNALLYEKQEDIISERTAELRESEERFRTILYSIGDAVITTDVKGNVVIMNNIAEQLTGWTEKDAYGKPLKKVFPIINEETGQKVESPVTRVLREGMVVGLANHTLLLNKLGQKLPIADSGAPIRDAEGAIVGVVLIFRDQTKEREAARALRENQRLLEQSYTEWMTTFDAMSDWVSLIDINSQKVLRTNSTGPKLLGIPKDQIIGQHCYKLVHGLDTPFPDCPLLRLRESRRRESMEFYQPEHQRWLSIIVDPIIKNDGSIDNVIHIVRDITERKQIEKNLQESEERFRTLIEYAPLGILSIDKTGKILQLNPRLLDILGSPSKDATMAINIFKFPLLQKAGVSGDFKKVIAKGTMVVNEVEYTSKWGKTTDIRYVLTPNFSEDKDITGAIGSFEEITERKQAEEKLRISEEKFHGIFDESVAAIYLFDTQKNFIDSNQAGLELLGYTMEELLKMSISQVDAEPEAVIPEHEQLLAGDRIINFEHRLKRMDGSIITVLNNSRPVTTADGNVIGLQSTLLDITSRKRAEEKIQKSLKEKEVLLKEIHHRVKNNLQVITSLLNLQSGSISGKRNREAFNDSRDRIRSIALVHEVLYQSEDYSRVDFGEYLKKLTGQLLQSFRRDAGSVSLDLKASSVKLSMDKAVPCGIVVNELVTNALKHAFPKGRKGKITVSLKKKKGQLELIVQDNGVGISHQTEEEATGSLGMNLVSILTEDQLNGTLKIEQNGGTSVKIQFPI